MSNVLRLWFPYSVTSNANLGSALQTRLQIAHRMSWLGQSWRLQEIGSHADRTQATRDHAEETEREAVQGLFDAGRL